MLDSLQENGFSIYSRNHASAILAGDFPEASRQIADILTKHKISASELIIGGGGESQPTQRLRKSWANIDWKTTPLKMIGGVNSYIKEQDTHAIDHVKTFKNGTIALEQEWNNKDTFIDRDINIFRMLHQLGGISLGIVLTRGADLQNDLASIVCRYAERHNIDSLEALTYHNIGATNRQKTIINKKISNGKSFKEAWSEIFVSDKYGMATTHWNKVVNKVKGEFGSSCPILCIGIPSSIIVED